MASSEVDQKALGNFAAMTGLENPFLSAVLYKILGLSVMLSTKLIRARRLRRLDPTRETKSLQLYYHILWLSREGLLMLEEFVLPMVEGYIELKILAYKLRASFYHIFVLFHNQPTVHSPGIRSLSSNATVSSEAPDADSSSKQDRDQSSRLSFYGKPEVLSVPIPNPPGIGGGSGASETFPHRRKGPQAPPPGLAPVQPPTRALSSFLLPVLDYTPTATACFNHASFLAERSLAGSHPLRLSVKLEYAAYIYDCLHDPHASRKIAKQAIADVYNAQEGMDDESFEDAAEIVRLLGKIVKRCANVQKSGSNSHSLSHGGSTTGSASVTPRAESSRSEGNRTPTKGKTASPRTAATTPLPPGTSPRTPKPISIRGGYQGSPVAVPNPTMVNPI
ncbi:14-3-3 domain-containing protein [Aspergillus egyptiacus]|nr:14-3-3 domain-containing protein [Aspergillus egyptiacus]